MRNRYLLLSVLAVLCSAAFSWGQDVKEGMGKVTQEDGSVYEGRFVDGLFSGKGVLTGADGRRYEGEFKDGLYDGQGVLIYADGSRYEGQFKEGYLHGQGVLTYADGTQYKGKFKYGEYVSARYVRTISQYQASGQ